ncbi:hypothetical protein ABZZ47_21850 [Streptomyces sp. NPDC006465]|uniref:hypothetical protein n=1 Tax=Streptomyces sp. NPDC006465 TaxID=3157174 RepID=UPI00339DBB7D
MNTEVTSENNDVAYPTPLGLVRASETALFIASPLLAAGSLSLIGVVCADANSFRFTGPALLLLVTAAISLLLSIQLGYHARQWIYSYDDLKNWTARRQPRPEDLDTQASDYKKGRKKLEHAGMAYNAGTVFLAFGVAFILAPRGHNELAVWRWFATAIVSAFAIGETAWILNTYLRWRHWLLRRRAIRSQRSLKEVGQNDV